MQNRYLFRYYLSSAGAPAECQVYWYKYIEMYFVEASDSYIKHTLWLIRVNLDFGPKGNWPHWMNTAELNPNVSCSSQLFIYLSRITITLNKFIRIYCHHKHVFYLVHVIYQYKRFVITSLCEIETSPSSAQNSHLRPSCLHFCTFNTGF